MKLLKNFIIGIVVFILGIAIIPLTIFGLYWLFFKVNIGGIMFIKFLPYKFDNLCEFIIRDIPESGGMALILGLAAIIGLAISCIPYFIIVIIAFRLLCKVRVWLAVRRKDAFCAFWYEYEDLFHLDHKQRMNGSEWLDYRQKIQDEYDAKEKQKKEEKKRNEEARQKQYQEYQERQHYHQNSDYSKDSGNSSSLSADLQKAMGMFFLESLDFTESELKSKRNRLIKSFHPDGSSDEEADTKNAQMINKYYAILKPYAKKG